TWPTRRGTEHVVPTISHGVLFQMTEPTVPAVADETPEPRATVRRRPRRAPQRQRTGRSSSRQPLFVVSCPRSGSSYFAKLLTDHGLRTAQYPSEDRRRYPAGY